MPYNRNLLSVGICKFLPTNIHPLSLSISLQNTNHSFSQTIQGYSQYKRQLLQQQNKCGGNFCFCFRRRRYPASLTVIIDAADDVVAADVFGFAIHFISYLSIQLNWKLLWKEPFLVPFLLPCFKQHLWTRYMKQSPLGLYT